MPATATARTARRLRFWHTGAALPGPVRPRRAYGAAAPQLVPLASRPHQDLGASGLRGGSGVPGCTPSSPETRILPANGTRA